MYNTWSIFDNGPRVTLFILIDGHKVVVGNVGDSSAVIGGLHKELNPIKGKHAWEKVFKCHDFETLLTSNIMLPPAGPSKAFTAQHLTIDHSPDDVKEFERM